MAPGIVLYAGSLRNLRKGTSLVSARSGMACRRRRAYATRAGEYHPAVIRKIRCPLGEGDDASMRQVVSSFPLIRIALSPETFEAFVR